MGVVTPTEVKNRRHTAEGTVLWTLQHNCGGWKRINQSEIAIKKIHGRKNPFFSMVGTTAVVVSLRCGLNCKQGLLIDKTEKN